VIAPWQVYDLPDEWLEGAKAITTKVESATKANAIIERRLANWRANHPAYNTKH
jgi:hypothetical protein